ncbi:MAG: cupin domain-containing protein [Promethearchaeota archaeon]
MAFINLEDIEEKELVPGAKGKFIHTENMTFAYWSIQAGSVFPEHAHSHEQTVSIFSGTFELQIGEQTKAIVPGEVGMIPSNVKHGGTAITDCQILDVFYPVREDYK